MEYKGTTEELAQMLDTLAADARKIMDAENSKQFQRLRAKGEYYAYQDAANIVRKWTPTNETPKQKYAVKTRHGWGWEIVGINGIVFQSHPIENAIQAEEAATLMNAGNTTEIAFHMAGLGYINGRYYNKR